MNKNFGKTNVFVKATGHLRKNSGNVFVRGTDSIVKTNKALGRRR